MISFQDAQNIVWEAARQRKLGTESIPVADIDGRVCAEDIFAPMSIQPFDNSAMDGFAVRRSDLTKASSENPIVLSCVNMVAAGDSVLDHQIESGTCVQIMTGAPTPKGAEAVVPIENVKLDGKNVAFNAYPKDMDNIRLAGEDFKRGDRLFQQGSLLKAAHILPLTTVGIGQVTVFKKSRGAFISTGNELVDDLSLSLESGQIYNSNGPYAKAILEKMGVDCIQTITLQDTPDAFLKKIHALEAMKLDFIVSSGAVSEGEFDFVKSCLEKVGAEILYHKIKLKPGKPNLLARLPSGALYFGLPGNPVATAVGLRFFVDPVLRAWTGQKKEASFLVTALNDFSKKAGRGFVLKGFLEVQESGTLGVHILDGQASFMVSPFLKMNCWVYVSEDVEGVQEGDFVTVYPLYSGALFV